MWYNRRDEKIDILDARKDAKKGVKKDIKWKRKKHL